MFKNPLKYQQGGKTQDALGQLVKWLVQNTGLDESQISQRLNQILSDDTAKQELVNNLQNMQKGDQNAAQNIIGMFTPQSAKFGGKIRDFICKHAKGGALKGCGCKKEGGEVENKKPGYSVREQRYPNGQLAGRDEYANGMVRSSLNPGTDGEWRWMGEEGSPFAIEPQSQRGRGPIIDTKYVNQNYWNWLNNQMDMARKYGTLDYKENGGRMLKGQLGVKINPGFSYLGEHSIKDAFNPKVSHIAWSGFNVNGEDVAVPTKQGANWSGMDYDSVYNNEGEKTMSRSMFNKLEDFYTRALPESNQVKTSDEERLAGMENGGKVLKGQRGLSSGRFDIPFGAYMKAYFNKRSTPDVGAATKRSFGYSTSNGNEYYLEDANVGRNSVDTWVNVTPKKDTIIMQKLPSDHINDLEDYQMEAIMQRMRPDIKRVNSKKKGGKVEKAQKGEKTNDTPYNGTISQGKPRSKVSQAIDNNSKARNFVKGAKQFVKSPMVKWPLAGALAYGGYRLGLTPTVQSMGDELAPHMAPYLFPFLSQLRPKFILDTMNPMKESPKVEKPGDVFWVANNKNGGNIEKAQDGSILDFYRNKWKNDFFD